MHHQLPTLSGTGGAAFLLRSPTTVSATIEHPQGLVLLIAGAPCLTVQLHTVIAPEGLRDECWRVAQEALDLRAATHRQAYSTKDGDREFITWQSGTCGYTLTIADTIQARWDAQMELTVLSPLGVPLHPAPLPPVQHHPALRYYRLSQLADDLFDAFRNAYLALEYLVSEVSPKNPGESEPNWLSRVLGEQLAPILPGGIDIPSFVESVYKFGRLPLFHAKSYSTIYLPHGPERSNVQNAFETTQAILAAIQHHRLNPRIASGWGRMSSLTSDAMARTAYVANQAVFGYGLQRLQVNADFEIVDNPRYFGSIWGRTQLIDPPPFPALERIDLLNGGLDWISMDLPACVPLAGVWRIRVELRQVQGNAKAPSRLHTS